jgi:hypothetical protein
MVCFRHEGDDDDDDDDDDSAHVAKFQNYV